MFDDKTNVSHFTEPFGISPEHHQTKKKNQSIMAK
jgi:hypothetical protein